MKNMKGFTLVEVLVSVLILSTGLLGLVGLQAAGVKNIVGSYNRTQASLLASSMADRIRANVADITAVTTGGASTYLTIVPANAQLQATCLTTAGCSVTQMAENDLYTWNLALQGKSDPLDTGNSNALIKTGQIQVYGDANGVNGVQGVAAIPVCPQTTPPPINITITVSWSENRDDNKDGVIDPSISFPTTFQIPRNPC